MTRADFQRRLAELEARATLAYGAAIARRTRNGGRYWHLGATIAAMACEPQRRAIEAWLVHETESLEAEFYAQL